MKIIRLTVTIISLFIFNLMAFLVNAQTRCSINISTGVDSTGTLLSVGSVEPHWVCPMSMDIVLTSSPWDDFVGSRWLGDKGGGVGDTTFIYTRSFTIPVGTVGGVIDFKSMADNYVEIFLDGISIAKTPGTPPTLYGFRLINAAKYAGSISSGSHILNAIVYNEPYSIAGFTLEGTVTYKFPISSSIDTTLCIGSPCTFKYDATHTNFKWYDGDTSRVKVFSKAGKYWRSSEKDCNFFIDSFTISYKNKDTVFYAQDTTLCIGSPCTFKYDATHTNFKWYDGDTSKVKVFSKAGKYWRISEKDCSFFIDSFRISYQNDTISYAHDTIICFQSQLSISSPVVDGAYLWNDGTMGQSNTLNALEKKWVHATDFKNCKVQIDTFKATFINFKINIPDTAMCNEQQIKLDATTANATQYVWQNNSTSPNYTVSKAGKYWVTVSIGKCKKTDTIEVISKDIIINLGNDTTLCKGETFLIESKVPNAQYLWQDGSRAASLLIKSEGRYSVSVTKDGCVGRDDIYVSFRQCNNCIAIPNAFTPNEDGRNDVFKPIMNCPTLQYSLLIVNRYGQEIFSTENPSQAWNGIFRQQEEEFGVYYYLIKVKFDYPGSNEEVYKGDVSLIR